MLKRGLKEDVYNPLALSFGELVGDAVEVPRRQDRREHLTERGSGDDTDHNGDQGECALDDEVRLHSVIIERSQLVEALHVSADEARDVASEVENDSEDAEEEEINEKLDDRLKIDEQQKSMHIILR